MDFVLAALSKVWCFFLFSWLQGIDFLCASSPFPGGGNLELHRTWSDYSSSYSNPSNQCRVRVRDITVPARKVHNLGDGGS